MNKLLANKIVVALANEVKDAAQKYYTDGTSNLTDAEFDAKVNKLKTLDPDNPVVTEVGWGYSVDEDSTPGQKVPHKYGPAGSLDKIRTGDEFKRAFNIKSNDPSAQYTASLKLDGISVVLYYEHGHLVQALTRGDGNIGIDITDKVLKINRDLEDIEARWFTGAVRGEIVMSYANFNRLLDIHPELKNPRNATAGIINRKEATDELPYLHILVYSVVGWECSSNIDIFSSDSAMWNFLEDQFFWTAPRESWKCLTSTNLDEEMDNLQRRWYGKFPADGIVITKQINTNQAPYITYESVAYKFPSEIKETTVVDVEWNLSKTNYYIPRVKVEPVELAGTTVQYATGFNAQYIKDNMIGKGAKIQITKRGEIIPYIVSVLESCTYISIPLECPSCHETMIWNGVQLQCNNKKCPNLLQQDLTVWLDTLAPVDGLKEDLRAKYMNKIIPVGDPSVETFMYFIRDITSENIGSIFSTEGHEGLMRKMIESFKARQSYSIKEALQALNIPRFGDVTCEKFARDPEKAQLFLTDLLYNKSTDIIRLTAYIGNSNAEALCANVDKIGRLAYIWDKIDWSTSSDKADTRLVAITGKLSVKRADFEKELLKYGFKAAEICKDTFCLITDDPNSSSAKNQKADKWNIPKVSEENFRKDYMHE